VYYNMHDVELDDGKLYTTKELVDLLHERAVKVATSWRQLVYDETGIDVKPELELTDDSSAELTESFSKLFLKGNDSKRGEQEMAVLDQQKLNNSGVQCTAFTEEDMKVFAESMKDGFAYRTMGKNQRNGESQTYNTFAIDFFDHASSIGNTVYTPNLLTTNNGAEDGVGRFMTWSRLLDPVEKAEACSLGEDGFGTPQLPTRRSKSDAFLDNNPKVSAIIESQLHEMMKINEKLNPQDHAEMEAASEPQPYLAFGCHREYCSTEYWSCTANFNAIGNVENLNDNDNMNDGTARVLDFGAALDNPESDLVDRTSESNVEFLSVMPPDSAAAANGHNDKNDWRKALIRAGVICTHPSLVAGGETIVEVSQLTSGTHIYRQDTHKPS
jgi:hypothetical protein